MKMVSLLLTASHFGDNFFLDLLQKMRPDDVNWGRVLRPTNEELVEASKILGLEPEKTKELIQSDPAQIWRKLSKAAKRPTIATAYYYDQPSVSGFWGAAGHSGRIIHLVRRNIFESFMLRELDQKVRKEQKRRGIGAIGLADITVTLDPSEARKHIVARLRDIQWARSRFQAGENYHELVLEEISRAPAACATAIAELYAKDDSAMAHPATVRIRRSSTVPRSNADIVENYSDVAHLDKDWI